MAIELSTAGILVKWAVGDTRPTTGYSVIRGVKSISEFNPEPSTLDVTDLSDKEFKRYISGLKDISGTQQLTVNDFADFRDDWDDLLEAANGGAVWFEYAIPGMDSYYYKGIPSPLGFNGADVDSVLENVAYITPNSAPVWATASTN